MNTKIVFMGSPDFALPSLKQLSSRYEVVGVITQPNKPAGRGGLMRPPSIKLLAESLGMATIQPGKLRSQEAMEQLRAWQPDLIVVAAYGQILRQEVLDLPAFGCVNVHASLLPRWRGAAPIQAMLLNGDEIGGVTIMRMNAGVDTGLILSQRSIPILPEETTRSLSQRLADLGADLLIDTLPMYLKGELEPKPQEEEGATKAPMLKKEDGKIDFNKPAIYLARMTRAYYPWPGVYSLWNNQILKVVKAHGVLKVGVQPGWEYTMDGFPAWGTLEGLLVLDELQPAGKKIMRGDVFLRGARLWGMNEGKDIKEGHGRICPGS
jgi:methionyl-tRNA formyltransferase